MFAAKNPPFGAYLNYHVKEWAGEDVSIAVTDSAGRSVRKLTGPGTPGFHRVVWDLQAGEPRERIGRSDLEGPLFVAPGRYSVKLTYGDVKTAPQTLRVDVPESLAAPSP